MGRVRSLPEALRSQIAAGEVVERPASVAKELIENSLDAQARSITLEIEAGGLGRLSVTDDGEGMDREDARACLGRHATSKLQTVEDLVALTTYGFRGEALPSIASVSRLTLTTRQPSLDEGWRVRVEGGTVLAEEPVGCTVGTRIDVRDLFFNVPARRKFQKSARSEATHVEDTLIRMALSNPGVDFRLVEDGREGVRAPAASDETHERERAEMVLGKAARGQLFSVDGRGGPYRVHGLVANPALSRGDTKGLYTFVNGRFVKDRTLNHAVIESYRTLLEVGRFPVVILKLEIPPEAVDVNVHPQKLEVRFADGSAIHHAVTSVLTPLLRTTPWLRTGQVTYSMPSTTPVAAVAEPSSSTGGDLAELHRARAKEALARFAGRMERGALEERVYTPPVTTGRPPVSTPGLGGATEFSRLRALGQVGLTYLLCEGPEGLVVLDQHAAHERVNFEKLRAGLGRGEIPAQRLLVPLRISLTRAEEEALQTHAELLGRAGFDVSSLGPGDALLRSVPALLHGKQPERVCKELLEELAESGASSPLQDALDAVLARVACHGSVRAGDPMTPMEINALLQSLDGVDLGAHCPHGRPVVRAISLDAMAAWFDRI
ncbi:MAG: DNA mismatch repair endonuclease MutL [Myxococcota bacterium]